MKYAVLCIAAVIFVSCINIFKPKDYEATPDVDVQTINDFDKLIVLGDAAMIHNDFLFAASCYERAVVLRPASGEGRLKASQALLASEGPEILSNLMLLSQTGSTNIISLMLLQISNSELWQAGGVLDKVYLLLNNKNGKNLFISGETDGAVSMLSFEANFNFITAAALLMPVKIFDSDNDFSYNETNVFPIAGGDLVAWDDGAEAVYLNYDLPSLTNAIVRLTVLVVSNHAEVMLNNNTNINLPAMDTDLKNLHDLAVELPLQHSASINFTRRISELEEAIGRITNIAPALAEWSYLTNITSAMLTNVNTAEFQSNTNFLSGNTFNQAHYDLCGAPAFIPGDPISSYTWTEWPLFASVNPAGAGSQSALVKLVNTFNNLTTNAVGSPNYVFMLSNNYLPDWSNYYTNLLNVSNSLTSLL